MSAIPGTEAIGGLDATALAARDALMASLSAASRTSGAASSGSAGSPDAATQRVNFLNLLITQMRNQNPLEPIDNNQMAEQLAQISQLEQMQLLNGSLKDALAAAQAAYAASLIGKTVTFVPEGESAEQAGAVTGVGVAGGQVSLLVGARSVPLANVVTIRGPAADAGAA
ncbi:MAG: hypothetical protein FJ288_05375 [Planctomycetes bacterium]|nr:hypothetical protein [Planctomycetota bacterium]